MNYSRPLIYGEEKPDDGTFYPDEEALRKAGQRLIDEAAERARKAQERIDKLMEPMKLWTLRSQAWDRAAACLKARDYDGYDAAMAEFNSIGEQVK